MPARRQSVAGADSPSASPSDSRARGAGGKEKETFGCPYPGCGQSYSRMEYLKRHQRKHQDVRPFHCKDCSKSFARSDVLLRHRRRCHPTPPPPDRTSHSPPPMHRGYPGVPISSSRTDAREASPNSRGRKHPRQSSGSEVDANQRNRPRTGEEEEEDEDRFAEGSRYRQNGMGNGGVYGMNSYYSGNAESSTYTPHLLPIFQQGPFAQGNNYHSQDDPNHLEDASVLLSMAYGGQSNSDSHPTVQGQRVVADDWGPNSTINMMMDATGNNGDQDHNTRSSSGPDADNSAATANQSMGNFLEAMNWLGGLKEGSTPGEGANSWNNSTNGAADSASRMLSPFPLSSMFSPSGFGPSLLPGTNENTDENSEETNRMVLSILDQLAMHEVPQTKVNPNPERPLLRLENKDMVDLAGPEPDVNSRFHLPADRFAGCYQIPHWALPPLKTLSLMANRTFDTVLNHFSFVHQPTFRLVDTAACLAFAICTVGGIRSSKQKWDYLLQRSDVPIDGTHQKTMDGPVPPGTGWEAMYNNNYKKNGQNDDDVSKVGKWENGHIVRNEKTNMLVKSFSLAQGVLMTEYNVALLQALILYHAPYFLSEEESERNLANMFLGTIVNITRQIGFFTRELDHFETSIQHPNEPYTPNELDMAWRRWIQLETRRRTAYMVYQLDTICALEGNIPCILTSCELADLPLPAPDSLWQAPTAEDWLQAVRKYRPMTLDEAMRRIFFLPTYGAFDALHETSDTKYYNLLNETQLGPFARVAMVLTLVRGIIDIGEGKRDRGDWRDLTDLWVSCTWLRPGKKMLDSRGNDLGHVSVESLRRRFTMGLERWRQGWDFDPTCPVPGSASASSSKSSPSIGVSPQSNASGSSGKENEKRLNYCEEALPYYWLAQALLNILNSAPSHEPGWNAFAPTLTNNMQGVKYGELLKSARTFTRLGEGICMASGACPSTLLSSLGPNNTALQSLTTTCPITGKVISTGTAVNGSVADSIPTIGSVDTDGSSIIGDRSGGQSDSLGMSSVEGISPELDGVDLADYLLGEGLGVLAS